MIPRRPRKDIVRIASAYPPRGGSVLHFSGSVPFDRILVPKRSFVCRRIRDARNTSHGTPLHRAGIGARRCNRDVGRADSAVCAGGGNHWRDCFQSARFPIGGYGGGRGNCGGGDSPGGLGGFWGGRPT